MYKLYIFYIIVFSLCSTLCFLWCVVHTHNVMQVLMNVSVFALYFIHVCFHSRSPYFIKQLPTPTTDDIEARVCLYDPSAYGNIAVELVELYVQ